MRKKLVTDSLFQIALILSVLRTNLDDYLNILNGYSQDNVLSEVLLGTTSAIVQTNNYHSNWDRSLDGFNHPKNLDSFISNHNFRDLYSLGEFRDTIEIETPNILAYLVPELRSQLSTSSQATDESSEPANSNNSNNNNNASSSSSLPLSQSLSWDSGVGTQTADNSQVSASTSDSESSVQSADQDVEQEEQSSNVGSELTREDINLIEILWRQDIDMGVGKETFDVNLRRELEEKEEHKIKNEQLKKNDSVDSEDGSHLTDLGQAVSFVRDDETGEMIPTLASIDAETGQTQLTSDQGLSIEEAIEILQGQSESSPPAQQQASPPEPVRQDSLEAELSELISSTVATPDVSLSRQVSIESHWHDVEDFISTQLVDINAPSTSTDSRITSTLLSPNTPIISSTTTTHQQQQQQQQQPRGILQQQQSYPQQQQFSLQALPTNESALLQNVTMGSIQTMDTSELLAALDSSMMAPPTGPSNDSQPMYNVNNTDTALFPNATITNSTNFLLDLLDENNLHDSEMPFHPSVDFFTPIKTETNLSDSAVGGSLSSAGSLSPYNSDSATSNMTSPFDHEPTAATMNSSMTFEHLEGATGGFEEFLSLTKDTKPERERYSFYSSDNHYSHRQKFKYQQHLNLSDTNSTELKVPVLQRHMRHNHTYGALPGQQPKERKCDTMARLMKIKAIDTSRDEKKAKRLHLPFTVEDIIHSPVEKFNDMLTKYKLTEPQLQLMKDIRRRGKNKVAAQNCRKRKMEVIETLEEEVDKMRHDRDALHRQKTLIDKERDKLRDKYNVMYREVFNSLRDEHGQPYDPAEYTLQHTPDGNVFLIPKNNTMDAVTSSGGGGTRGGGARSVDKKKKHHARK